MYVYLCARGRGQDMRPGSRPLSGILRPSSGLIQNVEGSGGFDSRPSSRGDIRVEGEGDMLLPALDKKKRLKSASRVTFPEAPGAIQVQTLRTSAEMDMSKVCVSVV
jgi:hypothetical protein